MAPLRVGSDAASSGDDDFHVSAVTTADGKRRVAPEREYVPARAHAAASTPALSLALATYVRPTRPSSSSSSSPSPPPSPARRPKRVRFAHTPESNKRARRAAQQAERAERLNQLIDDEAALIADLARFEAIVADFGRDEDVVAADLRDAQDFRERHEQQRLEHRVADLRARVRRRGVRDASHSRNGSVEQSGRREQHDDGNAIRKASH
ncbi:unnamed protein product [Agarophyton chilense]|eukprot:gb/GEZJ01003162.1/.p2 GENE.gb/GEZJ01003162.1/~~gb/GEZJ01003162.1/.p2  ORF type:complete len:238 (-),score=47.78 gb/GEZJ01003162.1/:910-1536(-)